jgi:hypothetical protein
VTITLDLPGELEHELSEEAARLGLPLAEYALRVLAGNRIAVPTDETPRTGAELVAFWEREGVVGGRADIEDPAGHARMLRDQAEHHTRS